MTRTPPSSPSRQVVAAEVRAAMARADIKASALAATIGMSTASMSERLNAHRAFNTDQLADIAEALGVDVFSLLAPPQGASEQVSA